jgi:hypothetical protein
VLDPHDHQRGRYVAVWLQIALGTIDGGGDVVIGRRDILSDALEVKPGQ